MKLVELLNKIRLENTPVIINGITGRITEIGEEVLTLEIIRKRDKGKDDKVMAREITYIPLRNIMTVSQGEKEIPKSQEEKAVETELAEI